jgi:hypothetical protein
LGLSTLPETTPANDDFENAKSPAAASALLPINLRLDKLCCFINFIGNTLVYTKVIN